MLANVVCIRISMHDSSEKTKLMPSKQIVGIHSATVAALLPMAQLDAIWPAMATHQRYVVVQTD